MLRDATKAVKAYRDAIKWFPNELEKENGPAEQEEFLKEVVVDAVAKARKQPKEKLAGDVEHTPASESVRQRSPGGAVTRLTPETTLNNIINAML
jgi:Sec-independent protein translocase protein TatA